MAADLWHPIETAPKDGSAILLWDGFSVFEGLWNGQWCNASLRPRPWSKEWQPLPRHSQGSSL